MNPLLSATLTRKTARRHSLLDNIMEFLFLGGIFSSRRHPISLRRLLRSHILFIDLHNPFGRIMKYSPMKVVEICTELFSLMFLTCTQQVLLTVPTYIKLLRSLCHVPDKWNPGIGESQVFYGDSKLSS